MVVEDTYLYSTGDWTIFRKTFGLTRPYPYGTLSQVSPTGALTCTNPGFQGTAPTQATVTTAKPPSTWNGRRRQRRTLPSSWRPAPTQTTFGGLIALENTLNGPAGSLPSVVSISYGEAEAANGAAPIWLITPHTSRPWRRAFRSSSPPATRTPPAPTTATCRPTASASADLPPRPTTSRSAASTSATRRRMSTPPPTGARPTAALTASRSPTSRRFRGTVPAPVGFLLRYFGLTPLAICNNPAVTSSTGSLNYFLNAFGGSGGPSGCATGTASRLEASSAEPARATPSRPIKAGCSAIRADGVRDIPDVSLFASNGFWDAYYVVCWSNPDTERWRRLYLHRRAQHLGRIRWHLGFVTDHGRDPGAGRSKDRQPLGKPQHHLLRAGQRRVRGIRECRPATPLPSTRPATPASFMTSPKATTSARARAQVGGLHQLLPRHCRWHLRDSVHFKHGQRSGIPHQRGWDFPTGIGSVNAYNLVMNWPAP